MASALDALDTREPADGGLGALPESNISDLYAAPDAPEIARDIDWLKAECTTFAAAYEGKLAGLDADGLLEAIRRYERRIPTVPGRGDELRGPALLPEHHRPPAGEVLRRPPGRADRPLDPLVFFTLELNRVDDARFASLVAADAELARYKPVLDRIRKMKPYQLSDELEKFLHDQSVVGPAAWNRLFDETMAGLEFEVDGENLPLEATLNLLSSRTAPSGRPAPRRWRRCSRPGCRSSRGSPTRWPSRRRWRTAGASCRRRRLAPPGQRGGARGGPGAARRRRRRLPAPLPPLLRAQGGGGPVSTSSRTGTATRRCRGSGPEDRLGRGARDRAGRYAGFEALTPKFAEPFFQRGWIDAPPRAGKASGALATHGDRAPPLRVPELHRRAAGRDDPRPRAGPWGAPEPRHRPATSCPPRR